MAVNSVISLPPFAEKVISKLRRFEECASDFEADGVDIGRHWLDLLTLLGLLNRTQRSPALWEITQQGEDLLATSPTCAKTQVEPVVPLVNPKTRYVRVPSREDPRYHEEWPEIEGGLVFDGVTYCNHLFEALKRERITLVETLPVGAVDE